MKAYKTIVSITKDTEYGYRERIDFIAEHHPQGGVEYYLMGFEDWEDGHTTRMANLRYARVSKEYGNAVYKQYLADGYTFKSKDTFEPMQMDMR